LDGHCIHALDLYSELHPFASWARMTNNAASAVAARDNALIGYSMGGRLALHLLADRPEIWSRVIILSGHPGLRSDAERAARRQADERWAQRFESEDWSTLMGAWNSQSVFGADRDNPRIETDYRREALAHCLREWSLGHQRDFRPLIADFATTITWMTGALDQKFANLARDLARAVPALEYVSVAHAGHRLIDVVDWPRLIEGHDVQPRRQ
jgi:2-succinyl-6-hydroxy-2,4-cyclohexadiene-1-carboxylate synthase